MTTKIGHAVARGLASITDTLAELEPVVQAVAARVPWFTVTAAGVTATITTQPQVQAAQQPSAGQDAGKTCPHCGR